MSMYDETIESLQQERIDINEHAQAIQATALAESRDLSEDEQHEVDKILSRFDQITESIARMQQLSEQTSALKKSVRKTDPQEPEPQNTVAPEQIRQPRRPVRIEAIDDKGKWGWKRFGEFAAAVRKAGLPGGGMDQRLLLNAPTTYSQEGVGADGGFAVPPDFRATIMEKVLAEDSLLARCDQMTSSSNTITFPTDETTPWQTSGGLQAYWEGENDQLAQSKVSLKETTVRLNKLAALVPVTEELMEDAGALDTYLRRRVPEKIDFAISKAIIQGTGVGQPLGIMNAPCLVSVAKRTAGSPDQAADTIEYDNIVKMYSRMYAPCRANAVWLINQDVEPALFSLAFDNLATDKVPVYLTANGLSGQPYATLMGKPVIPTQACETLGDNGDIIFADLTKYLIALKGGGMRIDVSMHLYFDYDATAYRFIMRVGGLPWWSSYITPRDGSSYLSCFVALAERA
jgi:HK97 family phage major capsid protein